MTSELNSVTSITYVAMLFWPLNASRSQMSQEEGDELSSIDLRASPQVKMFYFFHLPRADLRISSSSPPVEGEGEKQLEEQCPD